MLDIGVKAGSVISKNDFKYLHWFKDNITGDESFVEVVLYTGEVLGSMENGFWAVLFANLWSEK